MRNFDLNAKGSKLSSNNAAEALPPGTGEDLMLFNPGPSAVLVATGPTNAVAISTNDLSHSMVLASGEKSPYRIPAEHQFVVCQTLGGGVAQDVYCWRGEGS